MKSLNLNYKRLPQADFLQFFIAMGGSIILMFHAVNHEKIGGFSNLINILQDKFKDKCSVCHKSGYDTQGGFAFTNLDDEVITENSVNGSYSALTPGNAVRAISSMYNPDHLVQMPPVNHRISNKDKKQIAGFIMKYVKESDRPAVQKCIDNQDEASCSNLPF